MITKELVNDTPMTLRGFATAVIPNVLIPQEIPDEEDRAFVVQCCYNNLVLAGGDKPYQNDITSVLFKVFDQNDTVEFFLDKDLVEVAALNDNALGTLFPIGGFPSQPLLTGFKLDWAKVLIAHGEGNYTIRTERNLLTGTDTIVSVNYNLKTFSLQLADETVWIEWIQDGEIIDGLDYTGIQWFQAIRLLGFFGNRQEEIEEEIFKNSNYQTTQIKSEIFFNRIAELGPIPSCIGDVIPNLIQANIIQITDYNLNNFDYLLQQKVVKLKERADTEYNSKRLAVYNFTFKDSTENHIKINC